MKKNRSSHKEEQAPTLDDLLNDSRLARLFLRDEHKCALQLWILHVKSKQLIENRLLYGRLLPHNFSNDSWSASDGDKFRSYGQAKAKIIKLNLYIKSSICPEILKQLSAGRTISEINKDLKLTLPKKLENQIGTASLPTDELVYRPVAFLFNRDAYDHQSISSPHGGACAFSASITQTNKKALFCIDQDYDADLIGNVINELNEDTGLNFGGVDTARFGDLELIVFPSLDDSERPLLITKWIESPLTFLASFNPEQLPQFSNFQFRLSILNDGKTLYSVLTTATCNEKGEFVGQFELNEQLHALTDSSELEIFGFTSDNLKIGTLCCRRRDHYVREIRFQCQSVGQGSNPVKFDWLEKTAQSSAPARVKAALTINRGNTGFTSCIGGRDADPWVPENRDLASLFSRLHPTKSESRFFLRWGQGDEGRLEFVEWFRALLVKHEQNQIVIFDPYFEDAGLGLLLICAPPKADCIVFRTLPKPAKEKLRRRKSDNLIGRGIDNLLANCERNGDLLKRFKLRIFGLKEGRLHDRYILVMGADGLPVAGFHLSNSFQTVAQKFPLLITPIPADTLLNVEKYMDGLIQEMKKACPEGDAENPPIKLLFDSSTSPLKPSQHYELLRFLEDAQAGDILSAWTGEPSLRGLHGDPLKTRMKELNLLKETSLALINTGGLLNCIAKEKDNFSDFSETWNILGEVLAHSHVGDSYFPELKTESNFLDFLVQFLKASFARTSDGANQEVAIIDAALFRKLIKDLLHSPLRADRMFYRTKYTELTWAEYFTIRFLWWFNPKALLTLAETQIANIPSEPQPSEVVRLSLLSQIVGEITLSVQFNIDEEQQACLIRSQNGFLKWMGLCALENKLEKPNGLFSVLQQVRTFSHADQVQVLGWMIHHAADAPPKAEVYKGLVEALHNTLPATIPSEELKFLVDSMRGHMKQLGWAGAWLFKDVIAPLLQNDRADTDDACDIWVNELVALLGPEQGHQSRQFKQAHEGRTTNIAAFLFAHSSTERQQASLKSLGDVLKQEQRIIQQPLASTTNWERWNDALVVSMWILVFTRWSQYYLRPQSDSTLEKLSEEARSLAMIRSLEEWRSMGANELAAFLNQVEGLISSNSG